MKLLIVDVGNLYQATIRKWPGRRLDYQKIKDFAEADVCIALGHQVRKEAQGFMRVLKMIGFVTIYDKVDNLDTARASVHLAMNVVQSKHTELILGSNDPLILPLLKQQAERMIPVHLISVHPDRRLTNEVHTVTLIEEEMLLPLPGTIDKITEQREIEQPRGKKVYPGDKDEAAKK